MPWLLTLYCIAFLSLALWGYRDDFLSRKPGWFIGLDVISDALVLLMALCYWLEALRDVLAFDLTIIYVGTVCLNGFILTEEIKSELPDPDFSETENKTILAISFLAVCLFYGPLLYMGFLYAVMGKIH